MNNRSAKGIRRKDWADLVDNGQEGDFAWPSSDERDDAGNLVARHDWIYIYIPGSGVCRWGVDRPLENGCQWKWNGNEDAPTLTPSLHLVGTWHGWMTNGELVSC
jgi:hypothetical protein